MTKRTAPRPRLRARAVVSMGLAGAVLGTAWDRMHVAAGTLGYPHAAHGQPWWVPVEFGLVFVAIPLGIVAFGDPLPDRRSAARAGGELGWFTMVYALSAFLWRSPLVCTAVLAGLLLARAGALQRTGGANRIPAALLVAGGPAVEASLVAANLFAYSGRTPVLSIPVWLPVLYMHAVPLAVRATEAALWLGGVRTPRAENS